MQTLEQQSVEKNDLELRSLDAICVNESKLSHEWYHKLKYTAVGMAFGVVFVKAEIISWFRIQEMFRFQSFHMYGIIGSAVLVAMISIFFIKKFRIRTIYGEEIQFHDKKFNKGQIFGGLLFGFGWGISGACPGPLFALIGTGATVIAVSLISATFGTWVYGKLRDKLPH